MDFTAEWKSMWPISSTFSAPLLMPNKNQEASFGPLTFSPDPTSSTALLHSPSLAPRLPLPYPVLSLTSFLESNDVILSSAASVSSLLGDQLASSSSYFHGFNSLQLLQIPSTDSVIVFFPTGENFDRVGFSLLSVKDGILSGSSQTENFIQLAKEGNVNRQRITHLLVNQADDFCGDDVFGGVCSVTKHNNVVTVVGCVMVCTNYSVYWYRVGITTVYRENDYSVYLDYLGCADGKMLRGKEVVNACWSPHLSEECLVLLENGDLLMFDVSYSSGTEAKSVSFVSGNSRAFSKRMHVSLTDKLGLEKEESGEEGRSWFGCEFSWHPRIIIASHRDEVFLVDLRSPGKFDFCSLLKNQMVAMGKNDGFFALTRAGPDGFFFTVATRYLLLLCDVRKPLMPVLRWLHGIENPRCMTVFRLSELRSNAEDTKYKSASESGYCVFLGSFWDSDFSLFCYGPDVNGNGSVSSEISKFCNSYYAWGLPSELSLLGCDCKCGSCLVREEFSKESLPDWIDWRQKKHLALGFGILKPDLSGKLSSRDSRYGGFTLIRLLSSGRLEAQHYLAAWKPQVFSEAGHKRKGIFLEDNLLYDCNNSEFEGVKKFQHLKLDSLNAYLKGKLAKYILKKREKRKEHAPAKHVVESESSFHQKVCSKMKDSGHLRVKSSDAVSSVLKDISLPTSIHEIALRSTCAALPMNLLQLAFSTYSDFVEDPGNHDGEALEFLDIPDENQLPPFPFRNPSLRSNKWSSKVQPSNALVGPILPPQFLSELYKICMDESKEERELNQEESEADLQFKIQCDKVMEAVQEHVSGSNAKIQEEEDIVSLADDGDDMSSSTQKPKLRCHKPSAFLEDPEIVGLSKSGCDNDIYSTHVFRRSQKLVSDFSADMVGHELVDVGCPIELKFNDSNINFGPNELELLQKLKKQDIHFQKSFKPYQDYINRGDEME